MSSFSEPGYPAPGARIGRFRIIEQLGHGGMGVVYRAMEENLGREVALKVIAPHLAHDPEFRERFTREARAQASLESAHVVAVYAHGEEDGYLYLASQLVADGDLGRLIGAAGVPPLVDALDVIEQVASGLSDAHEAGLVHRDIKPGNVLVRIRGGSVRAYLADFGIARRMDADVTRFGTIAVGTPSYMAPELHGGAPAGPVTDVYALGCLLWVALTGTPPYAGDSAYQVVGAHVTQPVPQLQGDSAMVQATNRILRFAMAKDPRQRYQSAAAMRADLQAALRLPQTPGAAVPEPRGRTALRPSTPPPSTPPPAGPPPAGPPPAGPPPSGPPRTPTPPAWTPPRTAPPRRRTTWIAAVAVLAVLAVSVGAVAALTLGDGSGDDRGGEGAGPTSAGTSGATFAALAPDEILRAAEKEMKVLESVEVTGEFTDDGDRISVDVVVTSAGDCDGTLGFAGGGGTAQLRRVDGHVYLRPDDEFWDALVGDGTAALVEPVIGDRWLRTADQEEAFAEVCDLDELFEGDQSAREPTDLVTGGTEQVAGRDAVRIERESGQPPTIWVGVDEPHYLLRQEEGEGDYLEYSAFDADVRIEDLTPEEYLDEDDLLGG